MGRLQRYLRRLTAEEWAQLHKAAQQELQGKSLALIEKLRSTSFPQTLTPSEKELAKRIERWIWKGAFIQRHQLHPHYKPHPPEWQLLGAELYYAKGLTEEAHALLKANPKQTLHHLNFALTQLRWYLREGKTQDAYKIVQLIVKLAEKIKHSAENVRLQIILSRLIREYGGSYTAVGRRFLERISRLRRWSKPLPSDLEDLSAEINLCVVYYLAQGKAEEAYIFCKNSQIPPHPSLYLNQWTCSLLLRHSLADYLHYVSLLSRMSLSEYERAILLNRLFLTLLIYAHPNYISSKLSLIREWYQLSVKIPENSFAWAELLWLGGDSGEAAFILEELLPQLQDRPFSYLQVRIILLLIYIEKRNWFKVVRHASHLLYWLRTQRHAMASAQVLRHLLYQLYQARLRPRTLSKTAEKWKKHLAHYPTEKYFWDLTLLSDWIEAQLSRHTLREYRQKELRGSPQLLDALLQGVGQILSSASGEVPTTPDRDQTKSDPIG